LAQTTPDKAQTSNLTNLT